MRSDQLKCSVCGGVMTRVKVLPGKLGSLIRYRCTCGHCEDLKDDKLALHKDEEPFVLEGFQETL